MNTHRIQIFISKKISWHIMQISSLICLLVLLSSCSVKSEINGVESLPSQTSANIATAPTESITPTNIPTITTTPEPTGDYVETIRSIDESVLVYQRIYNENKKGIQFSYLNFSSVDGTGRDIRKVYFELPLPVQNSSKIWDVYFYNNDQSFIYTTYNLNVTNYSLFTYDIETGLSNQITNHATISDAKLSSSAKYISYTTFEDTAYVIDFSGYGYQYAPDINVYSIVLFAPDESAIAFIGNTSDNLDFHLFIVPLNEPNNSAQVTIDPVKKWDGNARGEAFHFSWAPDSKHIVYKKIIPGPKYSFCQINTESQQEICYPEHLFYHIGYFELSTENFLVVSGLEIPHEDKECLEYTSNELMSHLYILDFNTGDMSVICDDPYSNKNPIWTENEEFVLYEHYENEITQIYITDKTGSFHQPLTNSETDTYLLN